MLCSLAAGKKGDSPIKLVLKLGSQTNICAESQSEGTLQLVQIPWKLLIIISRCQRGTWEGVTVSTSCSELICRMNAGLVLHTIIIPAALSLMPVRGAAVGRALTIFQNDWFCTRISNFPQSPMCSIASGLCGLLQDDCFTVRQRRICARVSQSQFWRLLLGGH